MRFSLLDEAFHNESVVRVIFANEDNVNGAQGTFISDFIDQNLISNSYCATLDGYIKLSDKFVWSEISKHTSLFDGFKFFFKEIDEFLMEYVLSENKNLMKKRILSKDKNGVKLLPINSLDMFVKHSNLSYAIENYWGVYGLSIIFFKQENNDINNSIKQLFENAGLDFISSENWHQIDSSG